MMMGKCLLLNTLRWSTACGIDVIINWCEQVRNGRFGCEVAIYRRLLFSSLRSMLMRRLCSLIC